MSEQFKIGGLTFEETVEGLEFHLLRLIGLIEENKNLNIENKALKTKINELTVGDTAEDKESTTVGDTDECGLCDECSQSILKIRPSKNFIIAEDKEPTTVGDTEECGFYDESSQSILKIRPSKNFIIAEDIESIDEIPPSPECDSKKKRRYRKKKHGKSGRRN